MSVQTVARRFVPLCNMGAEQVKLDMGGHFAAWEQPELLTAELRAAFRSLR